MKPLHTSVQVLSLAGIAVALGGCASMKNLQITHIPPGESLNVALAKKPELVQLPTPVEPVATPGTAGPGGTVVEPPLPGESSVERVAEAYSRGEFCLGAGKDDEALQAFEECVKIDPAFTEAWQNLAMLYEKKGNSKKAMEAFRRAKKVAGR